MMRLLMLATVFALGASGLALAIDSAQAFEDPAMQERYLHLTRELRCLVCQNETIADSNVTLAADLRRELRGLLASGKSDDEVLKFLTDRYGDFVLYNPPLKARTWVLWTAPAFVLILALGSAAIIIRRRTKLPLDDEPEAGANIQ